MRLYFPSDLDEECLELNITGNVEFDIEWVESQLRNNDKIRSKVTRVEIISSHTVGTDEHEFSVDSVRDLFEAVGSLPNLQQVTIRDTDARLQLSTITQLIQSAGRGISNAKVCRNHGWQI